MIFDVTKYYHNKAFDLTEDERVFILDYIYGLQRERDIALAECAGRSEEEKTKYKAIADEAIADMRHARDTLEKRGILLAYNWPGRRGEWFFPTYGEAEMYEDWLIQCSDQRKIW